MFVLFIVNTHSIYNKKCAKVLKILEKKIGKKSRGTDLAKKQGQTPPL